MRYLLARLAAVEGRVRALVAARRQVDPAPDDPFRGLYLSPEVVDALLDRPPLRTDVALVPAEGRLAEVAGAFGLDDLDAELLLVTLAPDVDSRFEQLYGYLNDDVTRRRASIELALTLCGLPAADAGGRARVARLADAGLLDVEDSDRPLLSRALRVPDRVVAHLLGDDRVDTALAEVLREPLSAPVTPWEQLADGIRRGVRLHHLRHGTAGSGRAAAAAALEAAGHAVLDVDLGLPRGAAQDPTPLGPTLLGRVLAREALLRGAGVIAGPVDPTTEPALVRALAALPVPTVLTGTASWDPGWTPEVPLLLRVPDPGPEERRALWQSQLGCNGVDPVAETVQFRLGPEEIVRAARGARAAAAAAGTSVTGAALRAGSRAQNSAGLERLARHVAPAVGWSQLVLPDDVAAQLHELATRALHRDRVLGQWRMRPGGGRGMGVTALLTGGSGTGKTTAAEVIAAKLGLDLYVVDLAAVVDKYVGETEKNLDRIFTEAAGVNGVLLFDEADAVFGKRSAVSDAHDRYANMESAYLLQRMESFDGLAILATNLRANLDDAFTRRLDMVIDFPAPDEALRRRLWDVCLGPLIPRAADLDLDHCAAAFDLAGGDIRSAAVTAAYRAAAADRPVAQADLLHAIDGEYRKLGRLRPTT